MDYTIDMAVLNLNLNSQFKISSYYEAPPPPSYQLSSHLYIDSFSFHIEDMQTKIQGETVLPDNISTAEEVHDWIMSLSKNG